MARIRRCLGVLLSFLALLALEPLALAQEESAPQQPIPQPEQAQTSSTDPEEATRLRGDLAQANEELTSLRSSQGDLRRRLAVVEKERDQLSKTLKEELARGSKNIPDNFSAVQRLWLSDDSAAFLLKLNRPGFLKVRLFQVVSGVPVEVPVSYESSFVQQHVVPLTNLRADTVYQLHATILNWKQQETTFKADPISDPDLGFTTRPTPVPPSIEMKVKAVSAEGIAIEVSASTSARVRLLFYEYFTSRKGGKRLAGEPIGKALERDDYLRPQGGLEVGPGKAQEITFAEVEEGKTYSLEWEALDEMTGRRIATPQNDSFDLVTIPSRPTPLDFKGGFSLKLSPANVQLEWEATVPPERASLELVLNETPEGTVALNSTYVISGTKVKTEVPLLVIQNKVQQEANGTNKTRPLKFHVSMEKGSEKKSTDFTISFDLDKEEVGLTPEQKQAVGSILAAASEKKGKIRWEEIVRVGLPLILSFL